MDDLKLLSNDSLFLLHPKELERELITTIDVLRYSIVLIEDKYELLFSNLENKVKELNIETFKSNPILLDYAWAIIEKCHGFYQLVRKLLPEYIFSNVDLWNSIRLIRNTQQHLDERLDYFNLSTHPFLGYLSIVFEDESLKTNYNMFLLGGYVLKEVSFGTVGFKFFIYKNFKSVRLNSLDRSKSKHSVDLIEVFNELKSVITYIEKKIVTVMKENKLEKCDWTKIKDITIILK